MSSHPDRVRRNYPDGAPMFSHGGGRLVPIGMSGTNQALDRLIDCFAPQSDDDPCWFCSKTWSPAHSRYCPGWRD